MKNIISILLILSCLSASAQYERDNKDIYVALGIITTSIVFDAIGDGFNDSGNKVLGHSLNALSLAPLIISPFILDLKDYKWAWYLATYVTMRVAIFDPIYNTTRGLPIGYVGDSSLWDKSLRATKSPNSWIMAGRSLCFVVSISIPIREF